MKGIKNLQKVVESEDLEAKERRLRQLNESLENHQKEIVSKAQKLIQENVDFLRDPKLGVMNEDLLRNIVPLSDGHGESWDEETWYVDTKDDVNSCIEVTTKHAEMAAMRGTTGCKRKSRIAEDKEEKEELADLKMEEGIVGASKMSSSSQVKIHKARYQAMEKNFNELAGVVQQKDRELVEWTKKRDILFSENKKLSRQLSNINAKESKANRIAEESENQVALLRNQLNEEKRRLKELQRLAKERGQKTRTRDIKMSRALEEAEKAKKELLASRSENQTSITRRTQRISGLQDENKQLRMDNKQLVIAFKKQMKLVDILKRQKLHMEIMKLLSFSEETFLKLVSRGE